MTESKSIKSSVQSLKHPNPAKYFSLTDTIILIILLFFSFFSHTLHIAFPPSRVFDEVHFGSFTNHYITHTYFHDIHPPLGKLILYFTSYLADYKGNIDFHTKDNSFANRYYFTLRQAPSSFSSLVGPIGFVSMKFFGFSTLASFMVGIFLSTETMMIVEGRLILIDAFLHAFTALTILAVSILGSRQSSKTAVIFVSLVAGCTFSVKYTGMSVLVFICAHQFIYYSKSRLMHLFKLKNLSRGWKNYIISLLNIPFLKFINQMLIIIIISFTLMLLIFSYHISILHYHSHYENFLPWKMRNTLIDPSEKNLGRRTSSPGMLSRVFTLIQIMHQSNMRIKSNHSASSQWYDWPLIRFRSLVYHSRTYTLLLFPTPIIWYPAAISPLICLILSVFGYFFSNYKLTKLIIWPAGYYSSWLPFALIKRSIFIYHYLIPLIFGIFSFGALLDVLLMKFKKYRACIFTLLIVSAIGQYIFFMPLCTALKGYQWNIRKWYKKMY